MKTKIMLLAVMLFAVVMTGCEKDDEPSRNNYPSIIGSWNDVQITTGEHISSRMELIWTFNSNKTGTTRLVVSINGDVVREVTSKFNYDYKGSTIILNKEDGTSLNYSISVSGNKMRLGNKENGYFDLTKK